MKEIKKKVNVLGSMRALEEGEHVSFPLSKLMTVRSNAALINSTRGTLSLSTKIDREAGVVTVSRIA